LNLGCPSGTVVAKKKGSGLLGELDMLEHMLDKIYSTTDMKVSIKTRIGKESPEEFPEILNIFNRYPVYELIIHPRVRSDFYKNKPNMERFSWAVKESEHSLCYNGDVVTVEDFKAIDNRYPSVDSIMIGRGFLQNPMLANEIKDGAKPDMEYIKYFHDLVMEGYIEVMSGERPVLFKMKELWCYLIKLFPDAERYGKKIRKAEKLNVYREVVEELFERS
ncbi:MAG: tRNA-dihydrouridine synthase family protein, partial [Lachnospiraceae bacterium]|nr:tRNA-dihydrouridine synthase family protein [Lachnospiraceae bacterium]